MKFELTGNPFVDTGMMTMQAHVTEKLRQRKLEPLTSQIVSQSMTDEDGFGRWLATSNRQLNSFFMVCTNSALVNPSTNDSFRRTKQLGFLHEDDTGWKDYLETLRKLEDEVDNLPKNDSLDYDTLCESCGERPATKVLTRVGRDFFPLAGSLGNDAQALPAASRAPRVCALCLIAIQWLPIGAIMFNGKLACFQFTEQMLSERFVRETYRENRRRLGTAKVTDKILAYGSKQGASSAALILLEQLRRLKDEIYEYNLSDDVSLNIWAFSNSGANPDCEVFEINNPALQFLWQTAQNHYDEVIALLKHEDPKKSASHLLSAIERSVDYSGFYPRKLKKGEKKSKLTSPQLYELYQTKILKRPTTALESAKTLANLIYQRLISTDPKDKKQFAEDKKFLAKILSENPRWSKDRAVRVKLRKFIAEFVGNGDFSLEQYVRLFPAANLEEMNLANEDVTQFWNKPGSVVKLTLHGWDLFWFYLHHSANTTLEISPTGDAEIKQEDFIMFTNPKIKHFAADVFAMQMEKRGGKDAKRGLTFIKKNILDAFGREKFMNARLREWFCLLAETRPSYENEDFDALCRDEQGRDATAELRFQMRLEMMNLYRKQIESLENQSTIRS